VPGGSGVRLEIGLTCSLPADGIAEGGVIVISQGPNQGLLLMRMLGMHSSDQPEGPDPKIACLE
jgi:hypothetical protein